MKKNTSLRLSLLSLVFGFLSLTGSAANIYWVGGSGDWHNASHWSLTSGGKGGAQVPNLSDDAIFDENSFSSANETIILSGTVECRSLTFTYNVLPPIVSGSSSSHLNVYGSLFLTPQLTWNYKGEINFKSTANGNIINTCGKSISGDVTFEGTGVWQLRGALLLSPSAMLTLNSGSLVANGNAIQCGVLKIEGVSEKTLDAAHSIIAIKKDYSDAGAENLHSNTTGAKIYFQNLLPVNSLADIQRHHSAHNLTPNFTPDVTSVDSVITDPTCNAADTGLSCNGSIVITHINATDGGPFSISWAGPDDIDTVITYGAYTLCPNTYSYTIYDSASQTVYGPIFVNIVAPPPLTTNYIKRNVTCNGSCNGWIITRISGETPNYTYAWSNGPTGSAIGSPSNSFYDSNLCAGSYSIRIIDSRGCRNTFRTNVTQPLPVSISFNPTNVTCNGSCNGSVIATVTGGHGGYTYSWAPGGQTTATVTGLCAGTFTLTAKDDSGCIGTNTVTITQPTPIVITTSQTNVTCNGNCNGTATATISGGTPAYTYKWSNGATTAVVSSLCSGAYKIVVTDANGCKDSATVTITQPLTLNLTVSQTNVSCNGSCNGTATVSVSGGTPSYTYHWSNGATTLSVSSLCAGAYTIIVTDSNSCRDSATVTITQPTAIIITTTQTNLTCNGTCNGTATASVSGGTSAYTYLWSNGGTSSSVSSLCAGTYKIVVTDANGCKDSTNVTITQPAGMILTTTNTNVTCSANCIGTATVSVSGGNSPYTYHWSNGATTASVSSLCSGVYTIVVTDNQGCQDSAIVTVTEPNPINIAIAQTNVTCKGDCNGFATATVSGGTSPYAYNWTPSGGTNATASGLCAGVYKIVVTDANGCKDSVNITITQPATSISIATSQTNLTCNGTCNGTATVNASGGAPAYTYNWSNGATTATASSLCAGTYSVLVTDANGCTETASVTITQPSPLILTTSQTNIPCNGDCNGIASISVSGGTAPYTYKWNSGATTTSISNLCAGTSRIVVTDANGCKDSADVTITEPPVFSVTTAFSEVLCNGSCNGTAVATISGGTPPYTYKWNTGATTATINNLCPGVYTVIGTDNHGCADTLSVTISQPSAITVTTTQTNITCNGNCNGSATATASGGTPNYAYQWLPSGGTNSTATGLCAGVYTLVVTDSHNCKDSVDITITQPPALSVTVSQTNVTCNGNCDGTATANISGGTPAYTYLWSNGATTTSVNNLCSGNYAVVITDANGCTETVNFTITQPVLLTILTNQVNVSCNGNCNGQSIVSVGGGTTPYTYLWSPISGSNQAATGLCPGTYTITVTDNNNCSASESVTITQPATALSASITASTNVTCTGNCNGTATVSASGGTAPYTYLWSPSGGSNSTATGLCAGTYVVSVTDNNGCSVTTASVTITQPAMALSASITSSANVTCNGSCNGTATVTPSGGTAPYTYLWSPGGGSDSTASGLCANTYIVTVTDNNGCTTSVTIVITQPAPINISISSNNATCNGSCNGTASASASGGNIPYTYNWSNGQTTQSVSGLCAATYTLTVTDNSGCSSSETVTITAPPPLSISISANTINCHNACDGIAIVSVTGGTSPYTYVVSSVSSTNIYSSDTISNLCPGITYTITVEDANMCTIIDSVSFINPPGMTVINSITPSTCNSVNNGSVTVSVSNGNTPYTYSWSNGNTTQNLTNILSGTYTLTVQDASGCSIIDTVVVPSNITVIAIGGNDTAICALNPVTLNGDSSFNATTYEWFQMPGMNPISDSVLAFVTPSVTTTYILVASNGGCTDTSSTIVTIKTAVPVNPGTTQDIIPNQSVTLGGNPTAPSASSYLWEPGSSLSDSTGSNPVATPTVTTTYTVFVTNPNGCPNSDTVTIFVTPQITIPGGFSPNGDGVNDVWNIGHISDFPNVVVEVYNRWGELLFRSIGYTVPWDGTYTGKPVPIGTYYYIINLHDPRFTQTYTGPVTILR